MPWRSLFLAASLLPAAALAGETAEADLARQVVELKQKVEELAQRAGQAAPRIGFVNVDRVFEELDEKYDSNKELLQLERQYDARLREIDERIVDLEKAARTLNPDSPRYKKTLQELEEAKAELRDERAIAAERVLNKRFDIVHALYNKIREDVEAYARQNGYDLVLRVRDADIGNFDEDMRPDHRYFELKRRVDTRDVLFWQPASDFTGTIIKRLNERYAREKAARKPPTAPYPPDRPEREPREPRE